MTRHDPTAAVEGGGSLLVAMRVAGERVLVVGGGEVATGRVALSLAADADVHVVAPSASPTLQARARSGEITWHQRPYRQRDLLGAAAVMVAIDDVELSERIARSCRRRRIAVNVADVPDLCDFWFTSVWRDGPVQIAVSTNGRAPGLARRIRQRIEAALPTDVGAAAEGFSRIRARVRAARPEAAALQARMAWLTQLGRSWGWSRLASVDEHVVDALVQRFTAGQPPKEAPPVATAGRIRLVGAGPGDPELLTVAAGRALREAHVVFADRLVPDAILALVTGELRIVRKRHGTADRVQSRLDEQVLREAAAGRDVVRLKSGDPFVFGRGEEELTAYRAHGIAAEVIPGITSALAAPALAGIPATRRGAADRVLIATAAGQRHTLPALPRFDADTTVVLLMGVGRLPDLPRQLAAVGWPADWPAAIVERGGHPDARRTTTRVGELARVARRVGVRAPAVIVLGRVATAAYPEGDDGPVTSAGAVADVSRSSPGPRYPARVGSGGPRPGPGWPR
ncbi:MAG: uroporphyrinogen-III C-methyltransferase [Myxococcales bacterium]|nr:uroporphyrinogen-III C-methyltransferase [Myxococcales bacterium]